MPLSDFTLKSANLSANIELFERCCSNRDGFHIKNCQKPVDLHTIDNFLKELKSYSLVLFPGTAATVLFYRRFHSLGASHDRLASRGTCTPSGYPDLTPVNYMGVSFFVLVSVPIFFRTKYCVISLGQFFHLMTSWLRGKVLIGSACPLSPN